jgi:hypothetical protein
MHIRVCSQLRLELGKKGASDGESLAKCLILRELARTCDQQLDRQLFYGYLPEIVEAFIASQLCCSGR